MISELKTFLAVARLGTFAAAGDAMGLTQSAVSGQIKRLEGKLGHNLFERTGRAAELNATGLRVVEKAQTLLALAETLTEPDDPLSQEGTLKIGAIASAHVKQIPAVLPRFARAFPKMRQSVVPGTSLDLLDMVDRGALDLVIIVRPTFEPPASLMWTGLEVEPFVLVAPKGWDIDDPYVALRKLPFVRYSRISFGGRQVDRYLTRHHLRTQDFAELDDVATILSLVLDQRGISIVPKMDAYAAQFEAAQIIALDDPDFSREVGIVHPRLQPDATRRFITFCVDAS